MGRAVGLAGDAHGEAGDDEMALAGRTRKGSAPSATTPEPGRRTASSQGMAARTPAASSASTRSGGAPADQREPGPVEEHGRAAVELERIGPVLEGDGAGVQPGSGHGARAQPVRVAKRSWLSPPARGRIPTPE